jgi:hypothetical protein
MASQGCSTIVTMSIRVNHIDGEDEDQRTYLVVEMFHILLICDWLNIQDMGNLDISMSV